MLNDNALDHARARFKDTGDVAEAIKAYMENNADHSLMQLCENKRNRAKKYFAFEELERGRQEMQEVFVLQQMHARIMFLEGMAHRYFLQLKELGVKTP